MSDTDLSEKMIEGIPLDAIIDVKVDGRYFRDLKSAYNDYLVSGETKESIAAMLTNLGNKKLTSPKEFRLCLMLMLIEQIEAEAREQGKTKKYPLNLLEDSQK